MSFKRSALKCMFAAQSLVNIKSWFFNIFLSSPVHFATPLKANIFLPIGCFVYTYPLFFTFQFYFDSSFNIVTYGLICFTLNIKYLCRKYQYITSSLHFDHCRLMIWNAFYLRQNNLQGFWWQHHFKFWSSIHIWLNTT